MITLISNSKMGVCEYTISTIEELNKIDKTYISPDSKAYLTDATGMRVFVLIADKSAWLEL